MAVIILFLVFLNLILWSEVLYKSFFKRFYDIVFCSIALIVLSPLFLLTSIAIKLSSPGTVLYYSDRAGKNKRPFHFYKFRSMHMVDENHKQKDLYTADETRLFKVGRIIRKLKIDELPQLVNVVKGDMSIVGPRPMPITSVDKQYIGEFRRILEVKPGLTSAGSLYDYTEGELLATDEERYRQIIVPAKFKMELLYVEKESFFYDAFLVFRTIFTIILVMFGKRKFKYQPELSEISLDGEKESC